MKSPFRSSEHPVRLEAVRLVTRKPTAIEVALYEAERHREIMKTGLMDGPIFPPLKFYLKRLKDSTAELTEVSRRGKTHD